VDVQIVANPITLVNRTPAMLIRFASMLEAASVHMRIDGSDF
jgi:hypothetical protein